MTIEENPKFSSKEDESIHKQLFGGNKEYQWLKSFLGLLNSISYNKKTQHINQEIIMIQQKLKLLTILANLLVSNLLNINQDQTRQEVDSLRNLFKKYISYNQIDHSYYDN